MLTEDAPNQAERLLDRIDDERDAKSRALLTLAQKLRGHVHQIIDNLPDGMTVKLDNGTIYEVKRLYWNGRNKTLNRIRRNPGGTLVLLRNGRGLNNDRTRKWTVDGIEYETSSHYLEGDTVVLLGDENDLGAFWTERTQILERIADLERERTDRIRALLDTIPDVPPTD